MIKGRSSPRMMLPSRESNAEMNDTRFNSTTGNRFLELKPHRDAERIRAVKQGLIPDPLKPRRLDEALPFFGTCTQMCPEFERHEREYQNNSDKWERYPGTTRIDPLKAVKAFHRPAAGNDQPLPSDVRPPEILKATLDYLFNDLLPQESLFETHGFIRDRTRSIRQDFTLQNERGEMAIECHERIARYHISCLHFLRDKEGVGSYQEQQELEQVRKVLQSLNEFYDDFRGSNRMWPHEAEFRAYSLLTHLRDADATRSIEKLPQAIFMDPRLQSALKLHALAQCSNLTKPTAGRRPASSPATLNGFSRLFKQISDPRTSFLVACILETHFRDIRVAALKSIRSAQSRKYGAHVPLKELARACVMPLQECLDFCVACGLKVTRTTELKDSTVELHNSVAFDDQSITFRMSKSSMVTEKGHDLSISELVNGLYAHAKVSSATASAPCSARLPSELKASRVDLTSPTAHPPKTPRDHNLFSGSKTPARPPKRVSSLPSDKVAHKSTPSRAPSCALATPSLLDSNPSIQVIPCSPEISIPRIAKRELVSKTNDILSSQNNGVVPRPPSLKRTSIPSTLCAKALQLAARASAHKKPMSDLCDELLSSIIESIASHVAQQAQRNKVLRSLAKQARTTQHFVNHLSGSLRDEFFSDFESEIAFEVASNLVLERYRTRRQRRWLQTSFKKWLDTIRSHRPSRAKRQRSASTAQAREYFSPVRLRTSAWRQGGLRDAVCTFVSQNLLGPDNLAPEVAVEVVVVVPRTSSTSHSWLRCKFGINRHDSDRCIIKDKGVIISICIVREDQTLTSERVSQVVLLLFWHDVTPTSSSSINYAHWTNTVKHQSSYPVISFGISWLIEQSSPTSPDTGDTIVRLSVDNPENELQEALRNQAPRRSPIGKVLANLDDWICTFLSTWQDLLNKAAARLSRTPQASPKKFNSNAIANTVLDSGDLDIDLFDIVRLFDFLLDTVDLVVTSIGSLIGLSPATIDLTSLHLVKLSAMTSESFHSTLQAYQRALPMGYYSINLLTLLSSNPPLPLSDFFRLFCQHLATAILQLASETILAQRNHQHSHNLKPVHPIQLLTKFESQLEGLLHDLHAGNSRPWMETRRNHEVANSDQDSQSTSTHPSSKDPQDYATQAQAQQVSPSKETGKRPSQATLVAELKSLVQSTWNSLDL